jgi:hypothetical protein
MSVKEKFAFGVYQMPGAEWIAAYNERCQGTLAPTAEYWWAVCPVAYHYQVEVEDLGPHLDEVWCLNAAIVRHG